MKTKINWLKAIATTLIAFLSGLLGGQFSEPVAAAFSSEPMAGAEAVNIDSLYYAEVSAAFFYAHDDDSN